MERQKRVVAIHDISCVGRCSLTVALPIISSTGIETSIIPTAVLSTHTGGFTDYTYRDLTDDIMPIAEHFKSLNLSFDALYTGYLGSFEQLEIMSNFFDLFRTKENTILVDPVMADNGKLYDSFPKDFPKGMRNLCQKADVIVPNITEAVFMLEEPYKEGHYTPEYIEGLLNRLGNLGSKEVVLTGVHFDDKTLGTASYNTATRKVEYYFREKIDGYYHGTGDVFGSVLISSLMNNNTLEKSSEIAVDFTVECIKRTKQAGTDIKYGVDFERGIPQLIKRLNL